jgi:hypothetical protein
MFPEEFTEKYGAPHPSIRYRDLESDGDHREEGGTPENGSGVGRVLSQAKA